MNSRPRHRLWFAGALVVASACGGDVVGVTGADDGFDDGGVVVDGGAVYSPKVGPSSPTGTGGSSSGGGVSPPSRPPTDMPPPPRPTSTCGNGRLDRGEQCDGRLLNGESCATATMGAAPAGTLYCSSSCVLDTSDCYFSRGPYPGAGGVPGGGGAYGRGGTFGRRPVRPRPPIPVGGSYGYPPSRPYPPYPPGYYPPPPPYPYL